MLKQLYFENVSISGIAPQNRTNSDSIDTSGLLSAEPDVPPQSTMNGQPSSSVDINNISSTEQDTINVDQQARSSNPGELNSAIPMQNSNFNSMNAMSTMFAHCFSGLQQSLTQHYQNLNKGTNTDSSGCNLQQWYKAQSSTTNPMDQVRNINPMFQTGSQQDSVHPSYSIQQFDSRALSFQHGSQGVRSDSFSNVDIISPMLQNRSSRVRILTLRLF